MKVATLNINNVARRLPNLLDWLGRADPDVVCLQELKCEDRAFPAAALREAGYGAVWRGQRTWNGVAILARGADPIPTRYELPGDPDDAQSRYVEAAVGGILVGCLYAPNGNPAPGPKFGYKLAWLARFLAHAASLREAGVPAILAGDYNIVPTERDIYPGHSYADDALLSPEARHAFGQLLQSGWTDALRAVHGDAPMSTFWDYKRLRWPRDRGLRLDHLLVSPDLAARLLGAGIDREERGRDGASDHAPAWIRLAPAAAPAARARRSGRGSRRGA